MKVFRSILVGLPIFYFLVFIPLKAQLIMSLAVSNFGGFDTSVRMLGYANVTNPYDREVLSLLGDIAAKNNKFDAALWALGSAIKLSPGTPLYRARYGAALTAYGYDGTFALEEALKLEPNNPNYEALLRWTASQPR